MPLLDGCWSIKSLGWSNTFLPGSLEVRFDTVRADREHWRYLRTFPADTVSVPDYTAVWALTQRRDSVYIMLVGQRWDGLQLWLHIGTDSLKGRARRTADVVHALQGGPVAADRITCGRAA